MTIALGIPHAPWIDGRSASMVRLADALGVTMTGGGMASYDLQWSHGVKVRIFSERESNRSWARKLWEWGASTDAEWVLQLQDDALVFHRFWSALQAMLANFEHDCIGLEAAHPAGPLLAQQGHRWYCTRAWVVGVGWVLRRTVVEELLAWDGPATLNEDDYIGAFLNHTGRYAYHPIPTIIDHDVTVPSAYMNEGHALRRPTVLWDKYPEASLVDPEFWRIDGEVPMVMSPYVDVCWFCMTPRIATRTQVQSKHTGAVVCGWCIANVVNASMGRRVT